jgi:hypothetical protein
MKLNRMLVFCTICALSLFCLRGYGQDKDQAKGHPNGIVQDWSRRHVLYPRVGPLQPLIELQNDPRAVLTWQESARKDWRRWRYPHPVRAPQNGLHTDWSISLGTGSIAPAMYPAKYTFDITALPSCANDFVVFPINVAGSSTQPNIVAFNNLYSGSTPTSGICSSRTVSGGITDDVNSATVMWSYLINPDLANTTPTPGQNFTYSSPALSLDGKKVAFVVSDPNVGSTLGYFVVLAPRTGDGVGTDLQTVTSPVVITSFTPNAPVANSGTAAELDLFNFDSGSSPFIDYLNDVAYVGDSQGVLYRILNVFCTTVACTGAGSPAPSFDFGWPTGGGGIGRLSVCIGAQMTGPVVDRFGNVFFGCSDGNVYGLNSSGIALTGSPITVGDGSATGGIVDPPLVDMVNGYLYVAAGSSAGLTSVVAQIRDTGTAMNLVGTAPLDTGGAFNLHAPAFNEDYFSSSTASNWLLYEYSADTAGSNISLWGIGFSGSHVMNTTTPTNHGTAGIGAFERSPITTFFNGTTDFLFSSALGAGVDSDVVNYNITGGTFPAIGSNLAFAPEGLGTGGIIVDNNSSDAQASSIYFGVLGTGTNANSAVKLTQSALQ